MVAFNETITIVNRSGKVVSSSKHLVNIFNEAKSAYNERKAEIKALRQAKLSRQNDERIAQRKLESFHIDDDRERHAGSRRNSRHGNGDDRTQRRASRRTRPSVDRGVSDSFYINEQPTPPLPQRPSASPRPSSVRQESFPNDDPRRAGLVRRHTDSLVVPQTYELERPSSESSIDMDLAYGELPPPLPERKYDDEVLLRQKMSGLQRLLDECNCLQHSVTTIIETLQKNPEALAAVALTLAEISNLVAKLAPTGALATLKGAFPAIIALLASPEFAIAAGVGVGVTIIALGGYKIVKKIRAKRDALQPDDSRARQTESPDVGEDDELRELDHIEVWRRGIEEAEAESLGTSVDEELITPMASRALMRDGRLTRDDFKSRDGNERRSKTTKEKKDRGSRGTRSKTDGSKATKGTTKEPGGLRMLFRRSS